MSGDLRSQATSFIEGAEFPDLDSTSREGAVAGAAKSAHAFQRGEEQALVAGSDVIVFAKDVIPVYRRDVVYASVLAQLFAKNTVGTPQNGEDVLKWYDAYLRALSHIGFSLIGSEFGRSPYRADAVWLGDAILDIATVSLGPGAALSTVEKVLGSLPKLVPAVEVLDREGRSGRTARMQIMLVEPDNDVNLTLKLVAGWIEDVPDVSQPFLRLKSSDPTVRYQSSRLSLNLPVLNSIRDVLTQKVNPHVGNFIVGLWPLTANTADDWLSMAPAPRPLGEGQRWHVYISYRWVNRPWVRQLYDVLRALGYEVFMDEFVLTPGAHVQRSIEEGLRQSAGAVLVWSAQSEKSEWIEWETDWFHRREHDDERFRFIVVKLDRTPLPIELEQRVWVDFSDFRDGPSGTPLLQLLYGLRGEPMPREAVARAAQMDAEMRDLLARIQAARSVGDAERLSALANSDARPWHVSPVLLCNVADALIALSHFDRALVVIAECQRRFPNALRPQQLHALALARKGEWREAQLILEELRSRGERDSETLGILARTWADRYTATQERDALRRSRDLYSEAFDVSPEDYYVGINAAAKSVMLGDLEAGREYARRVMELVGSERSTEYWKTMTAAEVSLILGDFQRSAYLYRAGIAQESRAISSHEAAYRQARLLLEHIEVTEADRQSVLDAFGEVALRVRGAQQQQPASLEERLLVARLIYHLVASRQAAPDLLASLDPQRFWEALRKVRPTAQRADLSTIHASLGSEHGPSPNALWLAWVQMVRTRDLDRIVE